MKCSSVTIVKWRPTRYGRKCLQASTTARQEDRDEVLFPAVGSGWGVSARSTISLLRYALYGVVCGALAYALGKSLVILYRELHMVLANSHSACQVDVL